MAETTTDYGRQNLAWPDLGFDAGVNLHAAIVGSVAVLSDQISAKWSGSQAIPAGNTIQIAHNFGLSLGQLRIRIFESGAELTQGNDTDFGVSEVDVNTINIQNNDAVLRTIEIYVYPRAKMRGEDLDPAIAINTTGDATVGNMTVSGDLEVQGTTTTLNTATLDVEDANITINKGGTDASAEGAGLTIEGTGASDLGGIEYSSSAGSKFVVGDATKREIATIDGAQVITNKDVDGGTASNTNRITIPKGVDRATLDALTRKEATLLYDSNKKELLADDGTALQSIGSGGLTPLKIDHTFAGTIESGVEYVVDLSGGSLAVNLPVGLNDEAFKIGFNIQQVASGNTLTVNTQSAQNIYYNGLTDTSLIFRDVARAAFSWDNSDYTVEDTWFPTYANLPEATETEAGFVGTGVQTFGGNKTFSGDVTVNGDISGTITTKVVSLFNSGTVSQITPVTVFNLSDTGLWLIHAMSVGGAGVAQANTFKVTRRVSGDIVIIYSDPDMSAFFTLTHLGSGAMELSTASNSDTSYRASATKVL